MISVKKILMLILLCLIIATVVIVKSINATPVDKSLLARSVAYNGDKFENLDTNKKSAGNLWAIIKAYWGADTTDYEPAGALPVKEINRETLEALSDDKTHIIKLGHSSILIKSVGKYWLIDPVFAERASPFSFMGPKRFHEAPISMADLPELEAIIISHNHYDHLDKLAVKTLAPKTKHFFVPLGISGDLLNWGVGGNKIKEFVWWEELEQEGLKLTSTPAQHFSGRGMGDANSTLWTSWVFEFGSDKIYYSGDGGYFSGFKDIGNKLGPFDITIMETGAYNDLWADIHMKPEETVQAHIDLQGAYMIPAHNGTFNLALHTWYEPLDRVFAASEEHAVKLVTPKVGQITTIGDASKYPTERWWQQIERTK